MHLNPIEGVFNFILNGKKADQPAFVQTWSRRSMTEFRILDQIIKKTFAENLKQDTTTLEADYLNKPAILMQERHKCPTK